jgi:hypothetical protein
MMISMTVLSLTHDRDPCRCMRKLLQLLMVLGRSGMLYGDYDMRDA